MSVDISIQQVTDEAMAAFTVGRYADAARSFGIAASHYGEMGDPILQAEMANNQSVALLKAHMPEDSLRATTGTDLVFAGIGDWRRQGIALANQAAAQEALGNLDEAADRYRKSAEQFKRAGEIQLRCISLQSLSTIHFRRGHIWEALGVKRMALEEKEPLSLSERLLKKMLGAVSSLIRV